MPLAKSTFGIMCAKIVKLRLHLLVIQGKL